MDEFEEYLNTILKRRAEKGEDPEGKHCGDCVQYTTCKGIVDADAKACGNFKEF